MKFVVLSQEPTEYEKNTTYLIGHDLSWNDHGYYTSYNLKYRDTLNIVKNIGIVKIGELGMSEIKFVQDLADKLETSNKDNIFSLGCDEEYYINISKIEKNKGYSILEALNDFTVCTDIFEKAKNEGVTERSLLRDVKKENYKNHIDKFYNLLSQPIKLSAMKRIFGSTGWDDIDAGLITMESFLYNGGIGYEYSAIATIGRQVLVDIANKVYNDDLHRDKKKYPNPPNDEQFINKFCGYLDYMYNDKGISENIKKMVKSSAELVNGFVHKKNAEKFECFMCIQAVISLVYQITIVSKKDIYNNIIIKN